jgi:hypothetical protein
MRKIKFLTSLLIAVMFGACNNEEVLEQSVPTNGQEIEFRTLTGKPSLRASITDGNNITNFTVSAEWNMEEIYIFNGVTVTRDENGSSWNYYPKKMWPASGTVDFFAYSPASSVNLTQGLKDALYPVIKYTVPQVDLVNGHTSQEDFLIARNPGLSGGAVELHFQHALSRVVFEARSTIKDVDFLISKIELLNLKTTGTLNLDQSAIPAKDGFAYSNNQYDYVTLWTPEDDMQDYTVDMSATPVLVSYSVSDYTRVIGANNALMVLPQTTRLGATPYAGGDHFYVKVDYKALDGIRSSAYFRVMDLFGNEEAGITFEAGRQYTFQMTFDENSTGSSGIDFNVSVEDYDTDYANDTPLPQYVE